MAPRLRTFMLTAHVVSSVGWLGAAASFMALAVAGLNSQDGELVRAVYLAARPLMWFVLVPLCLASLLTGVVQALGTRWGLFRHYWILFKLILTVAATAVLLAYTQTVNHLAVAAVRTRGVDASGLQSYVLHAGGGLLILLVATILSVYKPRGVVWQESGK